MKITQAPFYSFFSIPFYREVIMMPLRKGFLYLLYLAGIATAVFAVYVSLILVPRVNNFIGWMQQEMPPLFWNGESLTMSTQEAYTMFHPELGLVAVIDTNQKDITLAQMGDAPVFVTSEKVYIKREGGGLNLYPLADFFNQGPDTRMEVQFDGNFIDQFYRSWKPWAIFSALVFYLPFFFIWKIVAALFYSLFGLLVNQFRKNKLPYSAVLNVTIFALTPMILIQLLGFFIPVLNLIFLGFFGAFVVMWIYLFLGIKLTESASEVEPPPESGL
ncbi:MAG: DUF1189 family protein [Candidatus Omnitrophica bacterium]|nr:DUF1189 family protein [Candidatus Omnitrophota bacterium]